MQPLKDVYFNPVFYNELSCLFSTVYPKFKGQSFVDEAVSQLPALELKQRITMTSELCRKYLPDNYKRALNLLYGISESITENFSYIFMPDFVARYGVGHFDLSLQALRDFTPYASSELALRAFLQKDFARTMRTVYRWAEDDNFHVRRLASEGTRPRLPWATRISRFLEDPTVNFPILDALHNDKEKYVRKSVANHLNDVSKDHPETMLALVNTWDHTRPDIHWVVKHALRSLVKRGHPGALTVLGADSHVDVAVSTFELGKNNLTLGESLPFEFTLSCDSSEPQKLVVDYRIYFVKSGGDLRSKVFKLKQLMLSPGEHVKLVKKHLFKDFTTRKHYSGKHALEVIVNGKPIMKKSFQLAV